MIHTMNLTNRRRFPIRIACLLPFVVLIAAAGCSNPASPSTSSGPYSQTDLVVGTGALAVSGSRVTVNYTGWLYNTSRTEGKGTQFDASASFPFTLGAGAVIRGWDQGVQGMRVGGQRRLIIPPELAYGASGFGNVIPPNATPVFDIGLLSVQ